MDPSAGFCSFSFTFLFRVVIPGSAEADVGQMCVGTGQPRTAPDPCFPPSEPWSTNTNERDKRSSFISVEKSSKTQKATESFRPIAGDPESGPTGHRRS